MSHTPGPWRVDEDGFVWGCCPGPAFMKTAHFLVAEVRGWGYLQYRADGEQVQAANARLIAAAPELYEELREILDYAREVYAQFGGDDEKRGRAPRIREDIVRVEALLKRLDGEDEDA